MTWISWTLHDVPLWLPDTWTDIDDYLFEINTTIKEYNESITLLGSRPAASREDYELKSIKWSPWRTLIWLWRREWIVLHGYRSYLDPAPQVITAVLIERSTRHFSYDGDHMRHTSSGDVWYAVEAITTEAFEVERSQGELPFPAESRAAVLMLPGPALVQPEPAASSSETEDPPSPAPKRRGRGPVSKAEHWITAFARVEDKRVLDATSLPSLFEEVLAKIPDEVKTKAKGRGFGSQSMCRHLRATYEERLRKLVQEVSNYQV